MEGSLNGFFSILVGVRLLLVGFLQKSGKLRNTGGALNWNLFPAAVIRFPMISSIFLESDSDFKEWSRPSLAGETILKVVGW